jgi:hypothetical protein
MSFFFHMQEFLVVFSSGQLYVSCYLQNFMKDHKIYEVWDEELIANVQRFGTKVCFRSSVVMYKVSYPENFTKSVIHHYLDCFYFDHLWGEERCNFKWKDYIIDLLQNDVDIDTIKTQMELAKQITSTKMEDVLKVTSESRFLIEEFHKNCKPEHFCDCIHQMTKLEAKTK